jgi:hypothetical protein
MANLRIGQVFAYLMMFFIFIILWEVSTFAIETVVNAIVGPNWLNLTTTSLDLPSPISLMTIALAQFPNLWNIGSVLFWGFVEEVSFIAFVLTGAAGAISGMGSRALAGLAIIQFLMMLALIESILSFIFSLLLGTPVSFPFLVWLEMMAYAFTNWFFTALHLLGTILGFAFSIFGFTEITFTMALDAFYEIMIKTLVLPVVVGYPAFAIFDNVLAPIAQSMFFLSLIVDTFIIGGIPMPLNPPPGNVMHLILSVHDVGTVITYLLSALTWLGLKQKGIVQGWIFYVGLSREKRQKTWSIYGIGEWTGSGDPTPPPDEDDPGIRGPNK